MPRMRTVKPDFWSDKNMVKLSAYARLFYIGTWNFALCDKGHLPDDVEELVLKILPRDPVDGDELLNELLKLDRIRRMYTADGESFLWIPRLPTHSKLDERWKTRCPYCTATLGSPPEETEPRGNSRESRSGSPELPETRPVVGSKGVGGMGVGSTGGTAAVVARPLRAREADEPPPTNEPPGAAEKILTTWISSLRRRPQRSIVDQLGAHIADALHDGCEPDEIADALALWQQRGDLGPRALPSLIHQVSQRVPDAPSEPGTNVVQFASRASPQRPSTTDARVNATLALAAQYEEAGL